MLTVKTTVLNEAGLHARPAGMLVKEAAKFKSSIELEGANKKVNAKSIMTVMALGLSKGTEVTLHIDGPDEEAAKDALVALFENGFGEL